jgi:glucan 1,3-beta-glucosidase
MWNLLLDTHHYEVFDSSSLEMSTQDHISTACQFGGQMTSSGHPTVAGEFCGAMTDCAKWLNGRNVGARYDGSYEGSYYIGSCDGYATGSVDGLSSEAKQNIGSFIQAQMSAFETANGWFFWTWKTEGAPEWDFQQLANAGVIDLSSIGMSSASTYREYSADQTVDSSACGGGW